uniref:Radiation-inducible immediate-early gene IEX-1 n=1 Tax=Oryzias sinensis TaxID=183150 RepID=A0A8C7XY10_9TELE
MRVKQNICLHFCHLHKCIQVMTVTLPQERFAFRSTEPEVFTFERIAPQATAVSSVVPVRPRKRCIRVMYPAKVRMHLPPPEKSQAKRWLVILCLVVLWQIYTEEPCMDAPLASAESSVSDYQSFPFQSAGDPTAQLPDLRSASAGISPPHQRRRSDSLRKEMNQKKL